VATTIAFDVYGTLVDPMGIVDSLSAQVGEDAPSFASAWRAKQLEYLFRRGLGRRYQPFSVCTRQALDFVCLDTGLDVPTSVRDTLMERYQCLPAFPDALAALVEARNRGWRCFAFSNGEPGDLAALLEHAGLSAHLDGSISTHDVRSFKPDPSVYGHFLENTGALLGQTWLVSSNPFDVIGSLEVGWKAAWVRRSPTQSFDPWGLEPTAVVQSLAELGAVID
jgi:2-haloacid dehalogenase